jgi:hypothetical protein
MKVYWLSVLALVACTRPNPAVCCLDKADCDEASLSEIRTCAPGLACVDHECVVPSCSTTGCEAATPVCNITTDVCEGCTDSSECSRFADTDVCDTGNGACVECVAASDCSAAEPVCDANACRACKLDTECPSGACGEDGACVAESAIVYLDPAGADTGGCSRPLPCRSVAFAVAQTSQSRNHLVFAPGGYSGATGITSANTQAAQLHFHGHGAHLYELNGDGTTLGVTVSSTIRDLEITGPTPGGEGLGLETGSFVVERVTVHGGNAISLHTVATLRDIKIDNSNIGIHLSGAAQLTLDRAVVTAGYRGINAMSGANVQISNVLVYGTPDLALNLALAAGTVSSSTIVDAGTDDGTGPRAVTCAGAITVRSSIIWAPGSALRVPIQGCNLLNTIAGPTSTPGALNADPMFANPAARDYRLAPNSPARDAVDVGPATDFEGESRPQGARFDIGADEAP